MNKKILAVYFDMQAVGINAGLNIAKQVKEALTEGLNNNEPVIKIISDSSKEMGIQFKVEEVDLNELTATDANGVKYIPIIFKDSGKENK